MSRVVDLTYGGQKPLGVEHFFPDQKAAGVRRIQRAKLILLANALSISAGCMKNLTILRH
jgi:hypothetical protein